jgi:hypothetical protein
MAHHSVRMGRLPFLSVQGKERMLRQRERTETRGLAGVTAFEGRVVRPGPLQTPWTHGSQRQTGRPESRWDAGPNYPPHERS